jgi:hypothetical protein
MHLSILKKKMEHVMGIKLETYRILVVAVGTEFKPKKKWM